MGGGTVVVVVGGSVVVVLVLVVVGAVVLLVVVVAAASVDTRSPPIRSTPPPMAAAVTAAPSTDAITCGDRRRARLGRPCRFDRAFAATALLVITGPPRRRARQLYNERWTRSIAPVTMPPA
jgi:hypothetical protein